MRWDFDGASTGPESCAGGNVAAGGLSDGGAGGVCMGWSRPLSTAVGLSKMGGPARSGADVSTGVPPGAPAGGTTAGCGCAGLSNILNIVTHCERIRHDIYLAIRTLKSTYAPFSTKPIKRFSAL